MESKLVNDEVLDKVTHIQDQIDALYKQQDELLDPLCKAVMAEDEPQQILKLISRLPTGFHRSELRTLHETRMLDPEYSARVDSPPSARLRP
jgi:hypothetical protein